MLRFICFNRKRYTFIGGNPVKIVFHSSERIYSVERDKFILGAHSFLLEKTVFSFAFSTLKGNITPLQGTRLFLLVYTLFRRVLVISK